MRGLRTAAVLAAALTFAAPVPATPPPMPFEILVLADPALSDDDRRRLGALPGILGHDHVFVPVPWDMGLAPPSPACAAARSVSERCIRDQFHRTRWRPTNNRAILLAAPAAGGRVRLTCIGRGPAAAIPERQSLTVDLRRATSGEASVRREAGRPIFGCLSVTLREVPAPGFPLDDPSGTTRPPSCTHADRLRRAC